MKRMNEVFELPVNVLDVGYSIHTVSDAEIYAAHAINHVDALAENLEEALIQIEYLHQKFGDTGSGNAVLSHGYAAINAYRGEK